MYVNVRAIIERTGEKGREIVIQRRVKAHENSTPYELPGGRLEEYESLLDGLKREVYEETGLTVTRIIGEESKIVSSIKESYVEAISPFGVYQTLQGPVDSIGIYFRCEASGNLLKRGDATEDIKWISVNELDASLQSQKIEFSWVDQSGILFYFKWLKDQNFIKGS